jgi:hypothetical protein
MFFTTRRPRSHLKYRRCEIIFVKSNGSLQIQKPHRILFWKFRNLVFIYAIKFLTRKN